MACKCTLCAVCELLRKRVLPWEHEGAYSLSVLWNDCASAHSPQLFHFDVHDDLRLGPIDARVEKDESHPGKVLERAWYERNKHIFPASRWEVYDPAVDYGKYTIGGGEVR